MNGSSKPKAQLLYWSHPFGAVEGPARLIADGLSERDWITSFLDVSNPDPSQLLDNIKNLVKNPPDLVVSMTLAPLLMWVGDNVLVEYIKSPVAVIFLDSPIYMPPSELNLLNRLPEGSLLLFVDANHAKHFRFGLKNINLDKFRIGFFPFGAPSLDSIEKISSPKERLDEKYFDLAIFATLDWQVDVNFSTSDRFTGVFPNLGGNKFQSKYDVVRQLAESMLNGSYDKDLIDVVDDLFGLAPMFGDKDEIEFLRIFDSYLKRYRRFNLIRSMMQGALKSDIRVALCGTGWNNINVIPPQWGLLGPKLYMEQFDIFKRSRLVLNLDPNWSHGVHDRVMNSMSVGTPTITNKNAFSSTWLTDGYDSLLFNTADEAVSKLMKLLNGEYSFLDADVLNSLSLTYSLWRDRCRIFEIFLESR